MTVHGSCLCGDVAWEADGPLEFMHHCHCGRCRKLHGAAFTTDLMCRTADARLVRGHEQIGRFESSPGAFRKFCRRCGSVVTDAEPAWQDFTFMPAGALDDDPGIRPVGHIFTASKASWVDISDDLPRFEAFPPGVDAAVLPDIVPPLAPADTPRGSCLCGGTTFAVEGAPLRAYNCHCSRCRKARGAAFASNLSIAADGLRLVQGEELLASYKVPEARFFTTVFCRRCGSKMPRVSPERGIAIIPMGSLDDDPGIRPQRHIFVGSKAPWYDITDDLPQDVAAPAA
jgi:hypothetical protein